MKTVESTVICAGCGHEYSEEEPKCPFCAKDNFGYWWIIVPLILLLIAGFSCSFRISVNVH